MMVPPIVNPLHFHSEEKGTSALTRPALPGKRSAIVSSVRLRSPALAAKRASAAVAAAGSAPSAASTDSSRSSPSVSVPVLSTQIVSTAARLSVALICCTSVSLRASRTAATAKVTLISSTSPSGISVTSPAVAVWAASTRSTLRSWKVSRRIAASGNIAQVQATITWLTSPCSGEGGWRKAFASPASRPA